jgi:hypothetical protein
VTDKLKTFIGKLGLWVTKLRKKPVWKQVKLELINVSYFPEAVTDKYKWITDSPQNYNIPLEEVNYINII